MKPSSAPKEVTLSPARTIGAVVGASALTISAALVSSGTAYADTLAPKSTFTMVVDQATGLTNTPSDGESVPNIDSVKSTIRAYYNASGGLSNKTSSRYISEVRALEHHILSSLPATAPANAALVFDVDDTLLWNYDFEDKETNFNFDPVKNAEWVTDHKFPAVPGMPELLRDLMDRGYDIYGITGRPGGAGGQEADTIANLTEQGFTDDGTPGGTPMFDAANMYTKDPVVVTAGVAAIPTQAWIDCTQDGTAGSCSTVEYKAETRDHIESLGADFVMNVGDHWSDLQGGFADDYT
jgi:hypothetical protein